MSLLNEDKQFLDKLGFNYELHALEDSVTLLIIKNYPVSKVFSNESVDVLIKIPKGYPNSQLDMFWVDPEIRFKNNGNYPPQADVFEDILNKKWQRFSRHYPWKPSYSIVQHINVIRDVLYNERG